MKNGKLVLEEYFYGYDRDDLHYLASATKSITSILVGISLDQIMIKNVDQYVYQLFPDYQRTDSWIEGMRIPFNFSLKISKCIMHEKGACSGNIRVMLN